MSIIGTIPFCLSGSCGFIDALFETVSGFTTTGASIFDDVEHLSKSILFFRSFTHFIGGMGILTFVMAVIPLSKKDNSMHILKAEMPGPSVSKLVPSTKKTLFYLYSIYIGLTVVEMILLLIGGMPLFDSILISMGTAGTGGFGIKNDSMASYTTYQRWVTTIFMILFGINFNAYYFMFFHNIKKAFAMEEVRYYLSIIAAAITVVSLETFRIFGSVFETLTHASFQVASIITTTGFSSVDFDTWSESSKVVLVLLMFIGACAGSTGGGIKVSRFILVIKTVFKEIGSYLHPRSIKKINLDDKPVEHEVMRATNVYFVTFFVIFVFSLLVVSLEEKDLVTNFTAVTATINNIGPGLEMVGPTANFAHFNPFTKWVLMFDMLAGRLELFPMLMLFVPQIWKDFFARTGTPASGK